MILAISIGAFLVSAFAAPSLSSNSLAQVTGESRVLQAILGLTEVIKGHTEALVDTTENMEDDLQFKKKFFTIDGSLSCAPSGCGFVLESSCDLIDQSACAFSVESLQITPITGVTGNMSKIAVDGVETDISDKGITTPTNLLVDTGIGKIGASQSVDIFWNAPSGERFAVIITGEKPQGLRLGVT
jgi:hypothetical protein